jgi:LCP family protein required for cell wall assembly
MRLSANRRDRSGRSKDHEPAIRRGWARWRHDPLWAKLCVGIGAFVLLASGVFVVGSKILVAYATNGIQQEDLLGADNRAQGKSINGPVNILLLGMDERANSTDLIRTDSIIVVHINAAHDSVTLISIPRDTKVDVPPFPATGFSGGVLKLTEAFGVANEKNGQGDPSLAGRQRGVQLIAKTIDTLVGGLKFDAVALINYVGFDNIVSALGGVTMCIDEKVISLHYDRNGTYVSDTIKRGIPGYVYNVGCRHLQPWEALDYVRQRENLPNGDYDRQRHQQQFLFAVFKQLLSKGTLTDVSKFGALRDAAGQLLTLDLGGTSLIDWIFSFKNIRASDITLVKTNGGTYASQDIDGKSYQILTPTSLDLLKAVRDDALFDFLAKHPDWIAKAS